MGSGRLVRCTAWLRDVQKTEKESKSKKGDGCGMAQAEGGLNSHNAMCYLVVAIMGSNVK